MADDKFILTPWNTRRLLGWSLLRVAAKSRTSPASVRVYELDAQSLRVPTRTKLDRVYTAMRTLLFRQAVREVRRRQAAAKGPKVESSHPSAVGEEGKCGTVHATWSTIRHAAENILANVGSDQSTLFTRQWQVEGHSPHGQWLVTVTMQKR